MDNQQEGSEWGSIMHTSVNDPVEQYLDRINREIYGDIIRKRALHGLLRLVCSSNYDHLTKKRIAKESDLTTKELYNHDVLESFSDFALVYLVDKVNDRKGAYVIPDSNLCQVLYDSDPHGLLRTHLDGNESVLRIIERFGERLGNADEVPIQSGHAGTPLETQMECEAIKHGITEPIDVTFRTESNTQDGSGNIRFAIEGTLSGEFRETDRKEIEDWLKRKMTSITAAALVKHRVCCPCSSLDEHLIKVEAGTEELLKQDTHYVEFISDDRAVFGTKLNKLKGD